MKKNIKLISAALLLGTQTLMGSFPPVFRDNVYFNRLTNKEKMTVISMSEKFSRQDLRYNRFHEIILAEIKEFVNEDPARALIRGFVWGILWNGVLIARHTRTLGTGLNKSKSWVNEKFARMGYTKDSVKNLLKFFPALCVLSTAELMQWVLLRPPTVAPSASVPAEGVGDDPLGTVGDLPFGGLDDLGLRVLDVSPMFEVPDSSKTFLPEGVVGDGRGGEKVAPLAPLSEQKGGDDLVGTWEDL
jgi:hypothetical protein